MVFFGHEMLRNELEVDLPVVAPSLSKPLSDDKKVIHVFQRLETQWKELNKGIKQISRKYAHQIILIWMRRSEDNVWSRTISLLLFR